MIRQMASLLWYLALPLLLLPVAPVVAQSGDTTPPVMVTGADGEQVRITDTSRLVTLGGSITEIVYALGLGDRVVATDESSTYPASILEKPRLGYYRQTSTEGILSQRPSLVLSIEGMGPPPVARQLRAAGVPVLLVPEAYTADEATQRIRTIAQALSRQDEGEALVQTLEADLQEAERLQDGTPPRVLFIYARGAGVINVAGRNTSGDAILDLAGGVNVVTGYEGYRPLTAEAVVTAAPEVIVLPQRSLESIGGVDGLLSQPGLALTPAGQDRRIIAVDDALLLSFGPRLGQGVQALTKSLYRSEDTSTGP